MSRRFLIAANWKMHPIPDGALEHDAPYQSHSDVDIEVFASTADLKACVDAKIVTGAQCARPEAEGAFTGDTSMRTVADIGCRSVLCGHSERRRYHSETDEFIAQQAIAALEHNLHPIVCIGETEQQRDAGKEKEVVAAQMKLLPVDSQITVAYEPVWAIGTGNTATPEQAQEMHAYIRSLVPENRRDHIRILYGGSMKPENARELLRQPDIDGGLVGGASLKPDTFADIVHIASELAAEK